MQFQNVTGQEAIVRHMQSAIRLGKVSHAYIINGEAGYGKLQLAETFAQALLCERLNIDEDENIGQESLFESEAMVPESIQLSDVTEPCGECTSCKKADHHNHPDIIYISHEKPNLISVQEIREQFVDTADILPYESKRKVYIVDDAEFINEQGQNILLKTIEEPPPFVTVLLLTTNKDKFLPTVLSRCVILNMMPVEDKVIKAYLMGEGIPDYQADMAISFASGNPGKAKLIASDPEFQVRRKSVAGIMRSFKDYNSKEIADIAADWDSDKENIDSYLGLMEAFLRDVMVYKTTDDKTRIHFTQEMSTVRELSDMPLSSINMMINTVRDAEDKIKSQVTLSLTIEMMLHRMQLLGEVE